MDEKEKKINEREEETERRNRKRGRRGGKRNNKRKREEEIEEGGRKVVRNKVGRTKYTQAIRSGEKKRREWTKEEEEKDYEIKEIVQEIELKGGGRQYRIQFVGFKKLADARWYDEEDVQEQWMRDTEGLGTKKEDIRRSKKEQKRQSGHYHKKEVTAK